MIERTYFISMVCYKNDGTGSFSYHNETVVVKSIMPHSPILIQDDMVKNAKKVYEERGIDAKNIHVIAFNRI